MINYKKILNTEQFQAANIVKGPGLIIAGAGSGKTATITYRTARLIERGINPENILLITFTNKAANEMKARICQLLGNDGEKVTAQTFHSFCANILRKYAPIIGIQSNYTIIDTEDSKKVLDEIISNLLTTNKKTSKKVRNDLPKTNVFVSMLTFIRNCNQSEDTAIQMFANDYISESGKIKYVLSEYTNYKIKHNLLDYDDLLFWTNQIFEQNKNIAQKVATKYQYIMIDEYQDSNQLQLSLIKNMIKDTHNNLVVVGDDQQSIYAFRGANFKNIINFQNDFPGAKLIVLDKNYRSTQGILNLANAIVNDAKEKYPKTLKAINQNNQRPIILKAYNQEEEYEIIIHEIQKLIRFGATYDDIAILSRNTQTSQFEMVLSKHNLKYKKYGGMKVFAKAHMKDVISYLKIISNIQDELAWKRVLNMISGIGNKTCEKIIDEILVNGYDGLLNFKKKKFGKNLIDLYEFIQYILKCPKVEDILSALFESYQSTYGFYYDYLIENYPKDYKKRIDELNTLIQTSYGYTDITNFLEDVVLDGTPEIEEDGVITLSTVHSAKGLEFNYVFILDCTDLNFPSSLSKTESEIEEERRIFYVAITRAKKELFLCVPRVSNCFGNYKESNISSFITNDIYLKYLDE